MTLAMTLIGLWVGFCLGFLAGRVVATSSSEEAPPSIVHERPNPRRPLS